MDLLDAHNYRIGIIPLDPERAIARAEYDAKSASEKKTDER